MEWCATGRVFLPDEALAAGLIRSVHEPDELLPAAYELAREIADNTSAIGHMTRAMLWHMLGAPHPMAAHQIDSPITEWCFQGPTSARARSASSRSGRRRSPTGCRPTSPSSSPCWEDPEF